MTMSAPHCSCDWAAWGPVGPCPVHGTRANRDALKRAFAARDTFHEALVAISEVMDKGAPDQRQLATINRILNEVLYD